MKDGWKVEFVNGLIGWTVFIALSGLGYLIYWGVRNGLYMTLFGHPYPEGNFSE